MAATDFTGPLLVEGNMDTLLSAAGQGQAASVLVPDPNPDAGPSVVYQGIALPDIRVWFQKDKTTGFTGVVPAHDMEGLIATANQIPATLSTANLCGLQNVVLGTAMTLAAATVGVTLNVPIVPFPVYCVLNGGTVTSAAIALDFGFAFGTVVAASTNVTVADSTMFRAGMPLVIEGVGNAAGTTCLLTSVISITSATVIVIADAPAASLNPAAIGTGNIWGPSPIGNQTPTAALPYLARGPGLFLDPRQGLTRAVRITSVVGAAGGDFLVSGWDIYGMPMTETVTVAAGNANANSQKCFKYIASVTPQFTDAQNYAVGTSDVFSFAMRADQIELIQATWNLVKVTDGVGIIAADTTSPTTATTNDVRGTIQLSAGGGGTPITNAANSNGTVVSLAMSGRRLLLSQQVTLANLVAGTNTDTRSIYGLTQA